MHPGDIVAGKYRVASILGRSRGLLLEARHTEFDQRVIIRLLSRAVCNEKEVEQFRREAKTLAKLESEHVARIIDVGTHSDGSFFLVRQHLEGATLAAHIRNHGALPLDQAVLYILQASEAVTECHHHNIILRELQPSHLFVTQKRGGSPLVKLIDFGTAKLMKDPAAEVVNGEMTATVMFGMSPYSSPELVRKIKDVDGRTDVWSLGCILYEMLAAAAPFQGDMAELMLKITREEAVPLSSLRPDLPRELDQIIGWAFAKDRDSRFKSVYAFAHALKPYASAEGQVLIDQIGRLAHAEKDRAGAVAISPTSPLAKRGHSPSFDDDGATVIRQAPQSSQPESPFEKTTFLPNADSLDRGSVPPPAPDRSSYPGATPHGGSIPPPRPRQGSWIEPDPLGPSGMAANATGGYPAQTPAGNRQEQRQRKMAVVAIGAALVLLPVLVVVLIFALSDGSDNVVAEVVPPASAVPTPGPAAGEADDDTESEEAPTDPDVAATAEPAPSADGDTPPDAATKVAGGQPTSGTKPSWKKGTPDDDGGKPSSAPPPPPPPPPPPKGGTGTLVAIAIGGSCSFAVDGAPRGKSSSIRIKVSVGPHSVSCTPPGGASRTQRVNVKAGKPGIASFRLN